MTTATAKPNRQARRKELTRSKLLEAANVIFLDKGVENTTATDIAEAADVAYGTFYNYFKSVDDLVPVAVEEELRNHQVKVKALQNQYDDPAMRVTIGVNTLFKSVMATPAIKWLTQKPAIMADEVARVLAEDAMDDIRNGVDKGDFNIPFDFDTLRTFCIWGITGVLNDLSSKPELLQVVADNMTTIYLRILGISDVKAKKLIEACPRLDQ